MIVDMCLTLYVEVKVEHHINELISNVLMFWMKMWCLI